MVNYFNGNNYSFLRFYSDNIDIYLLFPWLYNYIVHNILINIKHLEVNIK